MVSLDGCCGASPAGCRTKFTWNQSPLQAAVLRSDMVMATTLIEFGADTKKPLQDGRTVLTVAAHHGDIHMVECLLRARADINQHDKQGLTALTIAARRMQSPLIRLLVDAGADKDPISIKKGSSSVHGVAICWSS